MRTGVSITIALSIKRYSTYLVSFEAECAACQRLSPFYETFNDLKTYVLGIEVV